MSTRLIIPKWNEVNGDEGWVSALLSWHYSHQKRMGISLQTNFLGGRRPNMHERLELTADKLVDCNGETLALFSPQVDFPSFNLLDKCSGSTHELHFRASDVSAKELAPFSFYFIAFAEYLDVDRFPTSYLQIKLLDTRSIPVGATLHIHLQPMSALSWQLQASFGRTILCQAVLELAPNGTRESRYDITRRIFTSTEFRERAKQTRELDTPVRCTLTPFSHEMDATSPGFSYLTQATLAVSEVMEHIFPPDSPYVSEFQENGMVKYTVFWRSAAVHVFPDAALMFGKDQVVLSCTSWVERTGGSSFEVRVDFFNELTNQLVAATRFTLILMDIVSRKPTPVFYDKEWAAQHFAYGKQSPVTSASMQQIKFGQTQKQWSSPAFRYALEIRHSDQDLNKHVTSPMYIKFTDDAKYAATLAGYLPLTMDALHGSKTWIEYNEEMHRDETAQTAFILVRFQTSTTTNQIWIRYEFYNSEANLPNACNIVTVETQLKRTNKL